MSQISQRLALFFTANAGQAQATLGRLGGSFLTMGQNASRAGQQTSVVNSQMRALGTTFKYMVAGATIYGAMNMVRQLSQFQQQLGLISAIGSSAGFNLTGRNLGDLKNQLYGASTELIQPLGDVSDAVVNYLSTVQAGQGVGRNQIIPSILTIGKAARLSQTPIEDMTKALTTLNVEFGRPVNTRNIGDLAARWYQLISMVPGGISAAPQLVGQMANIGAGARLANVNPGQMLALTSGVLRFGVPPSQAGQGLGYLLRSLAAPESPGTVKSAREMFASLGISNNFVRQQGGYAALIKIFEATKRAGVGGNFQRAAQIARATGETADPNQISDLPISGAGVNVLATVFRRQHALRTAVALYSMWQSGRLGKDLELLNDSQSAYEQQQKKFAEAWRRFSDQAGLAKAATALQNIQMQIASSFAPILNVATKPVTWLQGLMQHHPGATQVASQATLALFATLGINRFLGGPLGKIPGLGRIPILGKLLGAGGALGQTALIAKTAEDFAKNAATKGLQDGSPERPFYVIVLGSIMAPPGSSGPVGSGTPGPQIPPVIGAAGRNLGKWKWLGRAFGVAGAAVLAQQLGDEIFNQQAGTWSGAQVMGVLGIGRHTFRMRDNQNLLADPFGHYFKYGKGIKGYQKLSQRDFLSEAFSDKQLDKGDKTFLAGLLHTDVRTIDRMINSGHAFEKAAKMMHGAMTNVKGDIALDITLHDAGKKGRARVHLPADTVFQGGKTPGATGQKKVIKTAVQW
jgi:TP901 family phage tail tape measure protein